MTLQEEIKHSMRLTNDKVNDIIKFNIENCFIDLEDQGIDISCFETKIKKAVELYCKWQMNYNGEAERFEKHYLSLRDTMSMQKRYRNDGEGE